MFPNELPGMLPDRAIEFKTELQPGTAPVYKRPYPMASNELAEVKTQLQELLNKGISDSAIHHGVVLLSL
jgi:hypothetical protein